MNNKTQYLIEYYNHQFQLLLYRKISILIKMGILIVTNVILFVTIFILNKNFIFNIFLLINFMGTMWTFTTNFFITVTFKENHFKDLSLIDMIKFSDIKSVTPNNIEDKIFVDYELLYIIKNNYEIQNEHADKLLKFKEMMSVSLLTTSVTFIIFMVIEIIK